MKQPDKTYLWQIHIFGEGNTRTTAVFLIKYMHTFGFKVKSQLFEQHSWYFRNALVRANYKNYVKNIHETDEFLMRFFGNLLLGETNTLQNREMHVNYVDTVKVENDTVKSKNDTVNATVFSLVKQNRHITTTEMSERLDLSLSTVKRKIKELKTQRLIERIGSDKSGYWQIIEK